MGPLLIILLLLSPAAPFVMAGVLIYLALTSRGQTDSTPIQGRSFG